MRLIARPRISIDHIRLAPIELLSPHPAEVVSIGHFLYKLSALFLFLLGLLLPLTPVMFTFILALVDDLLDFFIFFLGVILRQRFVILGDQLSHLLLKQNHDFVGADLSRFRLPVSIQLVFFFALQCRCNCAIFSDFPRSLSAA